MKTIQLICLLFLASCASKKENLSENNSKITLESICPDDGKCDIKIVKNQSISIENDALGKIFYKLKEDKNTSVVIFKYDRNVPKEVQDGNYREEIILEIDNASNEIIKEKSIYGRFCFCKGETGYYKIGLENCKSTKKEKNYTFDFKIKQVPQIINQISFNLVK